MVEIPEGAMAQRTVVLNEIRYYTKEVVFVGNIN